MQHGDVFQFLVWVLLPTFLKVCKQQFLCMYLEDFQQPLRWQIFAHSLNRQVPTLMLLRKLVAQKKCLRKCPRCFLPQNSGDGLPFPKILQVLNSINLFQGIHSLVLGPGLMNHPLCVYLYASKIFWPCRRLDKTTDI